MCNFYHFCISKDVLCYNFRMKFDFTFHSHTFRCGHADCDIPQLAQILYKQGFKIYGVSDHIFLPGIHHPRMRGDFSCLDEYISLFNKVKEEYKGKLDMYLGFEAEYIPHFYDYYLSLFKEKGFDYLICGQHFVYDKEGNLDRYFGFDNFDSEEGIERYKNDLIDAMKSGLFMYIAHPDLFFYTVTKVTPFIERITHEIIEAALKYDVPLEVNMCGAQSQKRFAQYGAIGYPASYFWEEVSKTNARVTVGGDFHSVNDPLDADNFEYISQFIKNHNLKLCSPIEMYNNYKKKFKNKFNI